MIFKPAIVARMWDTWLYYHEGKHYLFYLHNSRADARWDGMSVAVSEDGVHFVDHGPIIHKASDAVWLGTGMVWRVGDTFMLNFSEERNGDQSISFAESTDLLHWQRLPDEEYLSLADARWYAGTTRFGSQRWDCIWVLPNAAGPGYIGFLTAVAKSGPPGLCGTAGCVVSDDGRHFRAVPPVIDTGLWGDHVEVGAVESIGGRYYMLLGVGSMPLGARHLSRLPGGEGGMFILAADDQVGPYELDPRQPLLLGSSPHLYTYFARFYRHGDTLLLNHHTVPRRWQPDSPQDIYFAPLKEVQCDAAGILSLHWWAGNKALKGAAQAVVLEQCQLHRLLPEDCHFEAGAEGGELHAHAAAGGLAILPVHYDLARGVILEAEVSLAAANGPLCGVGLFIEGDRSGRGTILLQQSQGQFQIGPYDGYAFRPEDGKPLPLALNQSSRWRLLVRGTNVELYVNDELIQCYALSHAPSGRLGIVIEAANVRVSHVQAWEMTLS